LERKLINGERPLQSEKIELKENIDEINITLAL